MYNDAPLVLEDGIAPLAPGQRAVARIQPIAPPYWGELTAGATTYAHEGSRRVAVAEAIEVLLPQ